MQSELIFMPIKQFSLPFFAILIFLTSNSCTSSKPENQLHWQEELLQQVEEQRVLQLAVKQIEFGDRPSGSAALAECRDWLAKELEESGWEVVRQEFEATTLHGSITFVNIRARFGAGAHNWQQPVDTLYAAHYDTKFLENVHFVGANDGASAVALLLELAKVLPSNNEGKKLAENLEIVLFDGEEGIVKMDTPQLSDLRLPLSGDALWGSKYYATQILNQRVPRPKRVIVWDMVGDKNTPLQVSRDAAAEILVPIQKATKQITGKSMPYTRMAILDDHVPFMLLQIPATDIIQAELISPHSYWHTSGDTIDVLDAQTLAKHTKIAVQLLLELHTEN